MLTHPDDTLFGPDQQRFAELAEESPEPLWLKELPAHWDLSPRIVAILRDGVPQDDRCRVPIFNALKAVAMSLIRRSVDFDAFEEWCENHQPPLWLCAMTRRGRHYPPGFTLARKAWNWAQDYLDAADDNRDIEIVRHLDAVERGLRRQALTRHQRTVLSFLAAQIRRRGFFRVTAPVQEIQDTTGLPKVSAWRALKSLVDIGILECHDPGLWLGHGRRGKCAAIYSVIADGLDSSLGSDPTIAAKDSSGQHVSEAERVRGSSWNIRSSIPSATSPGLPYVSSKPRTQTQKPREMAEEDRKFISQYLKQRGKGALEALLLANIRRNAGLA